MWRLTVVFLFMGMLALANEHDHLYSVPSSASFARQGKVILALPNRSLKLTRFFRAAHEEDNVARSRIKTYLSYVVGLGDVVASDFVRDHDVNGSLADVAKLVYPDHPEDGLKRLLSFSHRNSRMSGLTRDQRREMYVSVENIRRGILLSVPLETFLAIFKDYFEREAYTERKSLDLSVPIQFYQGDNLDKLIDLARDNFALRRQSRLRYFLSIPRRSWIHKSREFFDLVEQIENRLNPASIASLFIDGIDLSGSIYEARSDFKDIAPELIAERFYELFGFCARHGLPLRIHAFEAEMVGAFYDGLERAIKKMIKSRRTFAFELKIGHINRLDLSWLTLFERLQKWHPELKLSFEANVASNMFLHDANIVHLTSQTIFIARRKLRIGWGSDGRGMLRLSAVSTQFNSILAHRKDGFHNGEERMLLFRIFGPEHPTDEADND